jgi:hypothetical protein
LGDRSIREVAWEYALTARMNVFYYERLGRLSCPAQKEFKGHAHGFQMLYQAGGADTELRAPLDSLAVTEVREAGDHPTPDEATLEKVRQEVLAPIGSLG